jgi:hypothetical protein
MQFTFTEENVDAAHTFIEGAIEVYEDDGDTKDPLYLELQRIMIETTGSLPVTVEVPDDFAADLADAIAD